MARSILLLVVLLLPFFGLAAEDAAHEAEGSHHLDLSPLLFVILAILIGAATRHFLKGIRLPYTVLLLVIGIGLGALSRSEVLRDLELGFMDLDFSMIDNSLTWAANIDPHLVLYIFLPILIFEAAFAMDTHTFRKSFVNSSLLAVPGILIAVFLTAGLVMAMIEGGIGFSDWHWELALIFGAVVSATDPVAVVSILKELGASKKLGTLIEGESLLNDGTAIVIFMVIFGTLTGTGSDTPAVLEFFRVAFGGIAIGLTVGYLSLRWIRKVFNDILIEITVIVGAAYITFFLAENVFHVSGVLGLVSLGLMMAGIGQRRISPEVQHFMHEFWEFAAFTANTLIFLIVGVVIAKRTVFSIEDFMVLGLLYVGIHLVRAVVILTLYPVMKNAGYGLSKPYAIVVWWGALRGAIGLALALIIAGEPSIPQAIRDDFLFLTAGIVTLTLMVNAVTMKAVVSSLGITRVSPGKAFVMRSAYEYIRTSGKNEVNRLQKDRFLKKANWNAVSEFLPKVPDISEDASITSSLSEERRRVLEKEKSSYWKQFKDGLLGDIAYKRLTNEINEMLDEKGEISLSDRTDLDNLLQIKKRMKGVSKFGPMKRFATRVFYEGLTTSYDVAQGFVHAQQDCMKLVESMQRGADPENEQQQENLSKIENEVSENIVQGLTFIRNLGKDYPEIYSAISTRQATRNLLNYERKTIERLHKNGRIAGDEAAAMKSSVEERMKRLLDDPPAAALPEAAAMLKEISWLKELDEDELKQAHSYFQTRIFAVGESIISQKTDAKDNGVFVITRGKVKVNVDGEDVEIFGLGNVIGELSVLSDSPRTATVTAETPVTTMFVHEVDFRKMMQDTPTVEHRIWEIGAERIAVNVLHRDNDFHEKSFKNLQTLVKSGKLIYCNEDQQFDCSSRITVLMTGRGNIEGKIPIHPMDAVHSGHVTVEAGSRVFVIET